MPAHKQQIQVPRFRPLEHPDHLVAYRRDTLVDCLLHHTWPQTRFSAHGYHIFDLKGPADLHHIAEQAVIPLLAPEGQCIHTGCKQVGSPINEWRFGISRNQF